MDSIDYNLLYEDYDEPRKLMIDSWFIFEQNNYYYFCLCLKEKADDRLYFAYWDHEPGLDIEEPVRKDLLSFLTEKEEESEDYENE